jgi:type III pantothenate kinase
VLKEHRLLIDVGNTSIKSGSYEPESASIGLISRHSHVHELSTLISAAKSVYLSNVGEDEITNYIQDACNNNNISLFIAKTEACAFGLINSYSIPSNMGVDRWLGMLACMQKSSNKTFLVVDIGTAMTIDAVKNGHHLGGWIVPGAALLKHSLFKNTHRVFSDNKNFRLTSFGNDTPRCVDNGCTAQILGTLLMADQEMKKNVDKFEIFLTGGDRNLFLSLNMQNIVEYENLVLEGLTLFVD